MRIILKIVAGLLLVFNGAGAIYGGYHLISHPDGSSLKMSTAYLEHSPFDNYLVPGIILFVMNGICSFIVLGLMLRRNRYAGLFVAGQGTILLGWIIVQVMLVTFIYYLHFVLGGCGILLVLCGLLLHRMEKSKTNVV